MTDRPPHPPKKTEMIEVRVSPETKRDFLDACRGAGRTASEVIREAVDDFVARSKSPALAVEAEAPKVIRLRERLPGKRWLAAGGVLAALSVATALPSAAQPDLTATFRALDANGDGVLSSDEYSARGKAERRELIKVKQGEPPVATSEDSPPVLFLLPSDAEAIERMRDVRYTRMAGAAPASPSGAQGFAASDANGDGRVDLTEFLTRQKELLANGFRRLDTDASGGLDAAEYEALARPFLLVPSGVDPAFGVSAKFGGLRSQQALEPEFVRRDADRNGVLSLEEYMPR